MEPAGRRENRPPRDERYSQKGKRTAAETTRPKMIWFRLNLRLILPPKIRGAVIRKTGIRYSRREKEKA
jgi:hypothetical protein